MVIEVEDDGRGLDWRGIRDVAVRRGLLERHEAEMMGEDEALNLIFEPGFSTRRSADEVSGRGVGMDVVKTNISRLSGMIDVETAVGRGTCFSITLPVTLAVIQALVILCGGQTFCIPLNAVLESLMVQKEEVKTVEGQEVISLRERTLPLIRLARLFELEEPAKKKSSKKKKKKPKVEKKPEIIPEELVQPEEVPPEEEEEEEEEIEEEIEEGGEEEAAPEEE